MRVLSTLLLVLLSACAVVEVPMADAARDAQGKRFETPAAGQAALYVIHVGSYSETPAMNISVGPQLVGGIANTNWLRIDLAAGRHDVRATGQDGSGRLVVDLTAGQTMFLTARYARMAFTGILTQVGEGEGRQLVLAGRRAQEIR